jgi:hypothetical protein
VDRAGGPGLSLPPAQPPAGRPVRLEKLVSTLMSSCEEDRCFGRCWSGCGGKANARPRRTASLRSEASIYPEDEGVC